MAVATGAALVLSACGGTKEATTDTTTAGATAAAMSPTPAAMAMMPITGTTHEVKMVGDATTYKYEPAEITIKAGDGIKFVMVSGGPHNVAFDAALVPAAVKPQLMANMPEQITELSGKFLTTAGESYIVSFAGIAPGTYDYFCTPHLAMNMKGKVTVQ
ncbi:MAG: cupredoxin domain-containing protein [Phycisphaerae bacterium]|nr:cupredoxin domain-containing protein [Gemmatimonadaceae bacterium]